MILRRREDTGTWKRKHKIALWEKDAWDKLQIRRKTGYRINEQERRPTGMAMSLKVFLTICTRWSEVVKCTLPPRREPREYNGQGACPQNRSRYIVKEKTPSSATKGRSILWSSSP
jgi:hypothetical protein